MKKRISAALLFTAYAVLTPFVSQADSIDDYYVIELTIFTNDNPANVDEEQWSSNITLSYPEHLGFLTNESINTVYPELTALTRQAQQPLPKTPFDKNSPESEPAIKPVSTHSGSSLSQKTKQDLPPVFLPKLDSSWQKHKAIAARINASKQHSVIFNQVWLQKLTEERDAPHIVLQGGKIQSGIHQLGGTINIYKDRYLYIGTNLWLVHFMDNYQNNKTQPEDNTSTQPEKTESVDAEESTSQANSNKNQWPLPPSITIPDYRKITDTQKTRTSAATTSRLPESTPPSVIDSSNADFLAIDRIVTMHQKRKMRSREIHYLDHPLFGLIVEIRPYATELR